MSENHYRILFETSENAIFMTSPAGQMIDLNPAWLKLFEYTRTEALKLTLSEMFAHPDEAERFWQEIEQQGAVKEFEAKFCKRDKVEIDGLITATRRRTKNGAAAGYQGIIRDITKDKQAEQALKADNLALEEKVAERTAQLEARVKQLESLNFITQMVASAHDTHAALEVVAREMVYLLDARNCGVALLNEEGTALTVVADYSQNPDEPRRVGVVLPLAGNPSSAQVVETGQSMVVRQPQTSPLTESVHSLLRAHQTECLMILPLLARGQVIGTIGVDTNEPGREFTPDEVMIAEMVAIQIAGIIQNVRLFDKDLEQAYQKLQQLDNLKTSFIGVITHELRSPFVAADLSVQLLRRYAERGMLEEILDQIKRLDQELLEGRRMLDSLISFASLMSKQGEVFLEETDVAVLTQEAAAHLEKLAKAREITLSFNFSPDLPKVYLDQQRMSEAIHHLVHNAIKFNQQGGSVEISCWPKDSRVFFKVKDTGQGVPADKLATIWQAFAQAADDVQRGLEGLGLGLALVRSAVEAHGGQVSAMSKVNEGSSFSFWIPIKPRPREKSGSFRLA
jgi:PAS domain S-box-containing protein